MDTVTMELYCKILEEELTPAMGCTEPISIAYAAATAGKALGKQAESMEILASGNIIKNVKSVIVPNTGGLRGIAAAAAAGMVAGDAERRLEVLAGITTSQQGEISRYLQSAPIEVRLVDSPFTLDITVIACAAGDTVKVRIVNYHTNIVLIEKNGEALYTAEPKSSNEDGLTDKSCLTVSGILDFADAVPIERLESTVGRQLEYNTAIALEGLRGSYGANIGQVLLSAYGSNVETRARAMAAAGSDARMNGCSLPVVIVSGSGNQGMTASLPVAEYAKELKLSREITLRAVALSDLLTLHIKDEIGRLSAYCGAVGAGCGSGAGIAYLYGLGKSRECRLKEISHTIVNSLAIVSGMVCDGAKASCAAKIASAVDAGILGYHMYRQGRQFKAGDGLISKGVEATIHNIGLLASRGMKETDREILDIMINRC